MTSSLPSALTAIEVRRAPDSSDALDPGYKSSKQTKPSTDFGSLSLSHLLEIAANAAFLFLPAAWSKTSPVLTNLLF